MIQQNYKKTLITCYVGFITQAIVANFTSLLFLRFHAEYDISIGRIALISTVFYISQILVDVFCAKFVDRIGYRKCVVASQIASAAGLVLLAFLPDLLPDHLSGILIAVVVYAVGSGLVEVLISPIVEACPFENKDSVMSLLHSFYCWGTVGVILLSTLFFMLFGIENWRIAACLWAVVPLVNAYNFSVCPIKRLIGEGEGMTIKELFGRPDFWVFVILMIGAGASEVSMAQWVSAFVESALGFPKSIGDLVGPCMFAAMMGLSRFIYGKFGQKINLTGFMLGSGMLCLACYLLTALSSSPAFGLIGCIVCGFSVGIMWPGSISISSERMPSGGTALFALLAMGGDFGASVGPGVIGLFTQSADDNMRAGMLAGIAFPIILITAICVIIVRIPKKKNKDNDFGGKND